MRRIRYRSRYFFRKHYARCASVMALIGLLLLAYTNCEQIRIHPKELHESGWRINDVATEPTVSH